MSDVIQLGHRMMPAGRYFVGDPCYCFKDHDLWMEWLKAADYESNPPILDASVNGFRVIAMGTLYGDGTYFDQHCTPFSVDAGLIGAVPMELALSQGYEETALKELGGVYSFEEDFTCASWSDGRIDVGYLRIETGDETASDQFWEDDDDESDL